MGFTLELPLFNHVFSRWFPTNTKLYVLECMFSIAIRVQWVRFIFIYSKILLKDSYMFLILEALLIFTLSILNTFSRYDIFIILLWKPTSLKHNRLLKFLSAKNELSPFRLLFSVWGLIGLLKHYKLLPRLLFTLQNLTVYPASEDTTYLSCKTWVNQIFTYLEATSQLAIFPNVWSFFLHIRP